MPKSGHAGSNANMIWLFIESEAVAHHNSYIVLVASQPPPTCSCTFETPLGAMKMFMRWLIYNVFVNFDANIDLFRKRFYLFFKKVFVVIYAILF
jgi:hypothetical protein